MDRRQEDKESKPTQPTDTFQHDEEMLTSLVIRMYSNYYHLHIDPRTIQPIKELMKTYAMHILRTQTTKES